MPCTSIKMFGKLFIGEILHVEQELDNAVDIFATRWSNTMKQLAIYHASTLKFCGILSHVAEKCA